MQRFFASVLCALALLSLGGSRAHATLAQYATQVTTGSPTSMSGATTLFQGFAGSRHNGQVYNAVTAFTIPFTFVLDGVGYNRISVSTNGLISMGSGNATNNGANDLTSTSSTYGQFPRIAAWWDQLYVTGGAQRNCGRSPSISYIITGSAPNRVVTVDFKDIDMASYAIAFASWQVRFVEANNAIEFVYSNLTSASCAGWGNYYTSGTIGIADASSDFISVTPSSSSPTFSTTSVNNFIDLSNTSYRPATNAIYRFFPCNISLSGTPGQGGTATMAAGDTIFRGMGVQRGNSITWQPLNILNSTAGCGSRNYSMAITGPHAADYVLNSTSGTIGAGGTVTPSITFTPSGTGVRTATLTILDDNGFARQFPLAASATTRIGFTGNVSQGGSSVASGDTLMRSMMVVRYQTGDFTPLTITNINGNPLTPGAPISVTIDSAGFPSTQYSIVGPSTASLLAGQSYTPVIRFSPTGLFAQPARLTVNAEGEIRTYTLLANSGAPGIEILSGGVLVDAGNPVFNNTTSCVGEVVTSVTSVPMVIRNIGMLPLSVENVDFYLVDTTYRQGTPMLPLVRENGNLVRITDYLISENPATLPLSISQSLPTPFVVAPLSSRTVWVTFVGEMPGKRFGRAFIRTNAENVFGQDTNAYDNISTFPTFVEGLFTADLVGRAQGARLAADMTGARMKGLSFPHTRVGDTAEMSFTIANTGTCDLRIGRNQFRITSGDVNEFKIVRALRLAGVDNQTGDYLLAPGVVDTVTVRFTPSRNGTRMATLWLKTNDSLILNPGITERGAYYLDLSGRGLAGLEAADVVLDPVIIGGSVSGTATLENTQTFPVAIASIDFEGDDAAQFSESGTWPARPITVLPGDKLMLGVQLRPTGDAGMRRTNLRLITTTGDTIRVPIRGEAGTQALLVSPTSLFDNVTIGVAQSFRQTVMITNNGTLPVRINDLRIVGPDSLNYRLGLMPRRTLDPGQTEYLEVTYAPRTPGLSSATLEVIPSFGPTQSVALGGNALKARLDPADPTYSANPGQQGDIKMRRNDGSRPGPTIR